MKTETIFQVQHKVGNGRWINSVWDAGNPFYFSTREAAEKKLDQFGPWLEYRVKEIEALGGLPIRRRRGVR